MPKKILKYMGWIDFMRSNIHSIQHDSDSNMEDWSWMLQKGKESTALVMAEMAEGEPPMITMLILWIAFPTFQTT